MTDAPVYLASDLLAEPLIGRWPAYDLLIPPHLLALHVGGQLDLLRSYLRFPAKHRAAIADPALTGGPWVDYATDRSPEVARLLADREAATAGLVQLGRDIRALEDRLRRETGDTLEPVYAEVPDGLRGYVELVYDLDHRASIRFLEALLYRSPHYPRAHQAWSLSSIRQDRRPAQWTTPVLDDPDRLIAPLAFDDPAIDQIFAADLRPIGFAALAELLRLDSDAARGVLRRLVRAAPPARRHQPPAAGVRVRYFGHASVLIETAEASVLVDPLLSYDYPGEPARFTYLDLPERIDVVLITHAHNDHLDLECLLRLRHRIGTLIVPRSAGGRLQDPSLKLLLRAVGFARVQEADELEAFALPGGQVVALPFLGEHCDLDIQAKRAWLVQFAGRSVVLAADSANLEPRLYDHLRALVGPIDVLFLGMECDGAPLSWAYGKLVSRPLARDFDRARTVSGSDAAQALALIEALGPTQVYVYAMGAEPWLQHVMVMPPDADSPRVHEPRELAALCRARGLVFEQLFARKQLELTPR